MKIEGVTYQVNWRRFKKGTSVFFPCLDYERAKAQLVAVTDRLGFKILVKPCIEANIRGLRVWRL